MGTARRPRAESVHPRAWRRPRRRSGGVLLVLAGSLVALVRDGVDVSAGGEGSPDPCPAPLPAVRPNASCRFRSASRPLRGGRQACNRAGRECPSARERLLAARCQRAPGGARDVADAAARMAMPARGAWRGADDDGDGEASPDLAGVGGSIIEPGYGAFRVKSSPTFKRSRTMGTGGEHIAKYRRMYQ